MSARAHTLLFTSLAFALAYWSPALRDWNATGFGDWQMIHHAWEVGRVAVTRYGELPLWNPFQCGGHSMIGNPESQHFTPYFLLSFALGTTTALKVFVVVHAAIGFASTFRYGQRVHGLTPTAALLCAVVFTGSGFFAWHEAGGHATFAPFFYLPACLLLLRRAEREPRYAIALAMLLSLIIAEGGTYPFPYTMLALAIECVAFGKLRASMLRALASSALLVPMLAAVRLLPILETLRRFPRTIETHDKLDGSDVIEMLTAREHDWHVPGHEYVWPEYGTYVGWAVLLLAGVALVRMAPRTCSLSAGVAALIFALLMMGTRWDELSPFSWLHRLPVFDSLRVPSRFAVLFTFHLAMLSGAGLDHLGRMVRRHHRARASIRAVIVLAVAVDIAIVTRPIVDRWNGPPVPRGEVAAHLHTIPLADFHGEVASLPGRNVGTTGCYNGAMNWPVSRRLWSGDVPQARTHAGRVLRVERTAGTFFADVELEHPGTVAFNTNFDPGWQASHGQMTEDGGLLALELPAGQHRIRLRFEPQSFRLGALISLITWPLAGLVLAFYGRWRPRSARPMSSDRNSKSVYHRLLSRCRCCTAVES